MSDYETDFHAWPQTQTAAIRAKEWASLDIEHVAEEIGTLGMNEKHAISRQLQRLLAHLLRWCYQAPHRSAAGHLPGGLPVVDRTDAG